MVFNHDYENTVRWFHVSRGMCREKQFSEQKTWILPRNHKICARSHVLLACFVSRSAGSMLKHNIILMKFLKDFHLFVILQCLWKNAAF